MGIMANIALKRYLAKTSRNARPKMAPKRKILGKRPSEPDAIPSGQYHMVDEASDSEVEEPDEEEQEEQMVLMDAGSSEDGQAEDEDEDPGVVLGGGSSNPALHLFYRFQRRHATLFYSFFTQARYSFKISDQAREN